ncbi:MAG: hypothetical protein K2X34_13215 [Hyphomonadaceae bacterium]|nr:hypothetical protein [Hyphomonadaceae bacterium]
MFRFIAFAAIAALAACASTPPPYAASTGSGAGYSETQIESNRYFVTYRAPNGADAALIQDYALLRAADLTLQNGREWFWVDRRSLDDTGGGGGPRVGVGVGGGSYGGSGGIGASVGLSFPLGNRGERANAATLEIRFGEGPKPDDPNAFNARDIAMNLRARLAQ